MNLTLGIDASLDYCSIALGNEERIVKDICVKTNDHTKNLAPLLNDIISDYRSLIKKILIIKGPGSFTAIRSSIACAVGIAAGLNIDVFGISGFQAIVQNIVSDGLNFLVVLESNTDQKYYQFLDQNYKSMSEPKSDVVSNILAHQDLSKFLLVSNIKQLIEDNRDIRNKYFVEHIIPANIVKMSMNFFLNLDPLYVRKPYVS